MGVGGKYCAAALQFSAPYVAGTTASDAAAAGTGAVNNVRLEIGRAHV